ncbi:hypothetical protein PMAYCL1PPCAC_22089, partial [Pristionchus mayeri]
HGETDQLPGTLFEVMSDCWSTLPSDRPTFTLLRRRLGELLEDVHRDHYLKLDAKSASYNVEDHAAKCVP